jgi:hypothetical protein
LRVRLDYLQTDTYLCGSRFYLGYAGAAPTPGNCATIAADIATAWNTNIGPHVHETYQLVEIDVLDIASVAGASGQWTGSDAGAVSGTALPSQCAMNVEFNIARRYRGGKPRMFVPPSQTSDQVNASHWASSVVTATTAYMLAFFTAVEAISVGAVGALSHVNLSYYSGFTNITNSSGRERAVPKYRAAALVDPVEGYAAKSLIGSQRRRRISTTY